eukprot:13383533-Alexandrium_andersonii.AAC.1
MCSGVSGLGAGASCKRTSRYLHGTTPAALGGTAALGCNVRLPAWTAANAGSAPAGAKLTPVA